MQKTRSSMMERLVAGVALCIAFLVMASVFSPAPTHADARHGSHGHTGNDAGGDGHGDPASHGSHELPSADPHQGLRSLGTVENGKYAVEMHATSAGPRYSIFDRGDGAALGALMSIEQVGLYFPDLDLDTLDFSANTTHLMLTEPQHP